ncbi:protein FAM173B isoform X4 [Heterocephalus glaber]|uniref:Protein FAM173B isoform X4 n=1 Tax=Heterocephalus glaber TaxID=10181 RepID=A0AAX6SZQ5_HETGA|nr:protein FAM173B isoform X4 [Heterocephalus glaber]
MVEPTSVFRSPGNLAMEGGRGAPSEVLQEERQCGHGVPPSSEASSVKRSGWGLLFTGVVGGALVAVYAVATPFITPALRKICLPFVPATAKQIENVMKMLRHRRGSLVDIGSGDGRVVTFSQYSNVVVFGVPQMGLINPEEHFGITALPPSFTEVMAVALHRCHSWRRNLNRNLRRTPESSRAGSLSRTGHQTTSLEPEWTPCGLMIWAL